MKGNESDTHARVEAVAELLGAEVFVFVSEAEGFTGPHEAHDNHSGRTRGQRHGGTGAALPNQSHVRRVQHHRAREGPAEHNTKNVM